MSGLFGSHGEVVVIGGGAAVAPGGVDVVVCAVQGTFLSIGYQAMKAIATFLVTWYNYFSRRFFLEGARS